MRRVLLPSDIRNWIVNFAEAYRSLGWDVTTGVQNFELEACSPDVIHFNWPEELTDWKLPSPAQVDAIITRLDCWAKRSRIIVTVNNLYPHRQFGNPIWHRLYSALYERAEVIHHFSQTSKDAVCSEYPASSNRNHLVRLGFNYDLLLPRKPVGRDVCRSAFDLTPRDVVYLVFGALRFWDEVKMVKNAFAQIKVPHKKLLMAGRYAEGGATWRQRCRRWHWRLWQQRSDVRPVNDFVPDDEVYRLFNASDVVVVVRKNSLSSGLPCLAMTFGRMVIAPRLGAAPEYLAGAKNLLFNPDAVQDLVAAMEEAAQLDRDSIGARNRDIASTWSWSGIIRACIESLPVN
jgi:glycosyltransferase involved in cell wall biosynthesis